MPINMALLARTTSIFIITNRNYSKLISSVSKSLTWKNLPSQFTFCRHLIFKHKSSKSGNEKNVNVDKFVTFDNVLQKRRSEARRSILVSITNQSWIPYVHKYCSRHGKIVSMFHYSTSNQDFVLIEFENESNVNAVIRAATHTDFNNNILVQSSCFSFRRIDSAMKHSVSSEIPLHAFNEVCTKSQLLNNLFRADTVSQQIENCYTLLKLDDLGIRLRFFTSYQIERYFIGMFPLIQILPFGSSVNGYGKMGCDLDLNMILDTNKVANNSKLIYLTKETNVNKSLLGLVGDLLDILSPGVSNVIKILHARVPIIKFNHDFTGLQCDLGYTDKSSIYMSELLYLYGEMDRRVRPVVFTIRMWAHNKNLTTTSTPGPHITNFSLTLLVLFYLQQKKILPSLQELKSKARHKDVRVGGDDGNCTFIRDISGIHNVNSEDVDSFTLLKGFFEYYSVFKYKYQGISLLEGTTINKMNDMPLLIQNPLSPNLNVSRNVSFKEVEKIRNRCREAVYELENISTVPTMSSWGILPLFCNNSNETFSPNVEVLMKESSVNKINSFSL